MPRSGYAQGKSCFTRLRRAALVLALWAPVTSFGSDLAASGKALASESITSISMEKDCFGCSSGERLVLHRDGLAVFTLTGKARHRSADQISVGRVSPEDFEALARLISAQGVLSMQDVYEDPLTRDGAWTVFTVERTGAAPKQVFRREAEGPAALDLIAAAIESLRARITLTRKHP